MKKKIRVICKAYENSIGVQIKKEIADCENEEKAIAYAANFIEGLNVENAVAIRFVNEDADVEYVIDADKVADAKETIAVMASAYDTDSTKQEIKKFEAGKTYGGKIGGGYELFNATVTKRTDKKITFSICCVSNQDRSFEKAALVSKMYTSINSRGEIYEVVDLKNPNISFYANSVICVVNDDDEIKKMEQDPEMFQRKAKLYYDEISTLWAFANINAAAVDIEDDGSNDDADEENFAMTLDYNFDVEEDDDDELVDEPSEIELEEKVIATADLNAELEEVHDLIDKKETEIYSFSQEISEYFSELSEAENRLLENRFDQHELKRKKAKIETLIAKLMGKLESVNDFINMVERHIVADETDIKKIKSGIANMENCITDRGVEIYELSEKALKLEAEILNRKIAESYADSIVTTAAFDTSVEGEIARSILDSKSERK